MGTIARLPAPWRIYGAVLPAVVLISFLGGAVASYNYAKKHPAADTYNPVVANLIDTPTLPPSRTQVVASVAPSRVVKAARYIESTQPEYGTLANPVMYAGGRDHIADWAAEHPDGETYVYPGYTEVCEPQRDQADELLGRTCTTKSNTVTAPPKPH